MSEDTNKNLFNEIDIIENINIFNAFVTAKSKLENVNYEKIMVSVSGGADSDILVDMIYRLGLKDKVNFVWFDTGLEYQATKDHLDYLEEKYDINIEREKAIKPIPLACKEYGQPFISKQVSEYIQILQRHNFKWEDKPFEELYKEYPGSKVALRWWCNNWNKNSNFNISRNKYLKEFMIENPPNFKISNLCCKYAKKDVAKKYTKQNNIDLSIYGVRKAEGGIRSIAYKNCFSTYDGKADEYRMLYWLTNADKEEYEQYYNITHSDCYTKYGFVRTGCAGCPYAKDPTLEVLKEYEPKLYNAVNHIFKESYEYTKKYREFVKEQRAKEKEIKNQLKINR